MNNKTKDLTLNALFMAITIVMALVPNLGMIHLGVVSITIMHIPVIIAGLVLGLRGALINATAFGVSSMLISAIRPVGPLDVFFVNPLVSVVPRILFGISVALIFNALSKTKMGFVLKAGITAALSTLLHTIFVLVPLYFLIFKSGNAELAGSLPSSVSIFIWGTLISNGFLEIVASVLVSVPVAKALRNMRKSS